MKIKSECKVENMAAELTGDRDIVRRMDECRKATEFVWSLTQMRIANGLNQRQMAEKMGVSKSKLSRIEACADADLNFGDIQKYVAALGMDMSIMFDSADIPAAKRIRQHVLAVHSLLERLCDISRQVGATDDISRKIKEFYGEVLLNFVLGVDESHSKLPVGEPLQFTVPSMQESCVTA